MDGDLGQQRIIVRGYHRAGEGGTTVQTHAETGGRAVGNDLAVVGDKGVFRIFGGHAALDRYPARAAIFLGLGHPGFGQRRTASDQQLGLNDID